MKELLPIIMSNTDENTVFYDCFGGGMNVVCEIPLKNKIACDVNKYIISLWNNISSKGLQTLDLPKDAKSFTREMYNDVRCDYINFGNKFDDWYKGYVGTCCSYGGAWFNGYASYNEKKREDHISEAYRGLESQVNNFQFLDTTKFVCCSYEQIDFDDNCVIFCDPPYMGTKKYESDFDHIIFWEWARNMSKKYKRVYITEYEAPSDFQCIWSKEKKDGMGNKGATKIEKLWTLKTNLQDQH